MDSIADFIIAHCAHYFPRPCTTCGKLFPDLRAYFACTSPIGTPLVYERHHGPDALGTLSFANCECGSTLSVRCGDPESEDYHRFMEWLDAETQRTGRSANAVLDELRRVIRARVLEDVAS